MESTLSMDPIDAAVGVGVVSLVLTIISVVLLVLKLRHAPIKPSLQHWFLLVQVAYLIADAFRVGRAVWIKLYTNASQLATHIAPIVHSLYVPFFIETTCVTMMLLLTTLRFHLFSVTAVIYMVVTVLVVVLALVFYIVLVALWAASGRKNVSIFQEGREGHLLVACSVFMLLVTGLILICNSVAVWFTSRKAFRKINKGEKTLGRQDSIKPTARQKAPKVYQILPFLILGFFLVVLNLVVLITTDSEVQMSVYGFFLRVSQMVALVYIVVLGKPWSDWMRALGEERMERKSPLSNDMEEEPQWVNLDWANMDDF